MTRICSAVLGLFLLAPHAWGQDVPSGPEKGRAVPALKVFAATGPHEGKDIDYAAERKAKPTVYLFVQAEKWDRPMARFVRKLDEAVSQVGGEGRVVAVWVGGDPDKAKAYLPLAQQSLQLQTTTLACHTGDRAGPAGWNVNDEAHLTAVVAGNGRVASVFGYRSVNETNVAEVAEALKKAR